MRAVSLVRGVVGAGAGLGTATGVDAAAVVPLGRGKGVLGSGGRGGGVVAAGAGGGTVRDTGTPATGGLGMGTFPGFGTKGTAVGGGSEAGGRDGRLIRTVSSSSGTAASPPRGGRVIRTVSFFGSFASAMVSMTGGKMSLSEMSRFVTRQLTFGQ
jgi:hypothetical protein